MSNNEQRDELQAVIYGYFGPPSQIKPYKKSPVEQDRELAETILAAGYRKPRTITTVEELDALPIGSVVLAHWSDNSQPDYQMARCPEGAASAGGGFGVGGGSHWLNMASWGATLTVIHEPTTEATK